MSVQLSHDQRKAADGIYELLNNTGPNKHAIAVLTGSAGTGKTTIIIELIKLFQMNTEVLLCATTNRAAVVLQDIADVATCTAHSLFKLKPVISKYGKEKLVRASKCEIRAGSVVIVDESSMVSNNFLTAIVDIIKDRALKVIFVGDPYQLPPVKDTCSIFDGSLPTFTLTKVHRQNEGNPILDKAIEFRDYISGKISTEPALVTSINSLDEGIHVIEHDIFVNKFVKKYISYKPGESVTAPLCTYTNDSAINYNNMIRKAAYFLEDTIAPFYVGEMLISNNIVEVNNKIVLTNNETVTVSSYSATTHEGITGHMVYVHGDYDKQTKSRFKRVFMPVNKSAANVVLDKLKQNALRNREWEKFYRLKNSLADLRPPFAGTTHKAQGGTFTSVFIDQVNIKKCKDPITRARLMYVALTRATKDVFINS